MVARISDLEASVKIVACLIMNIIVNNECMNKEMLKLMSQLKNPSKVKKQAMINVEIN